MKSELPRNVVKMIWDLTEVAKTQTVTNIISSAKANDIKITHDDLQKLVYIVNSSIEQASLNSSRNFEGRIREMMEAEVSAEIASKSSKK